MGDRNKAGERLWAQAWTGPTTPRIGAPLVENLMPVALAASLITSVIDAGLTAAAKYLSSDHIFSIGTTERLAFLFRVDNAAQQTSSLAIDRIVVNLGTSRVNVNASGEVIKDKSYEDSPVVIALRYANPADYDPRRTATAVDVMTWKYDGFLVRSGGLFENRQHRIELDVQAERPDGTVVLKTALQFTSENPATAAAKASLPWLSRPVGSVPADAANGEYFDPGNLRVTLTETASPSKAAKELAQLLPLGKSAIDDYISARAKQLIDPSIALSARQGAAAAASAELTKYQSAYKALVDASNARRPDDPASQNSYNAARNAFLVEEDVARRACEAVNIPFMRLPSP